jgi:hypothetical protein
VAASEDNSVGYNSSVVRVGVVDSVSYSISFGEAAVYAENIQYSWTPSISALSSNQFALCYYDGTVAMTKVGTIISGTTSIVLSTGIPFADNSDYDVVFDVVGLSTSAYLAIHYNAKLSDSEPETYSGSLNVTIIFVNSNGADTTVSLGRSFVSTNTVVTGFMYGIRLNDNSAVIAYGDYSTNGGTSVQALTVSNELTTGTTLSTNYSVTFGSVWQVTVGQSVVMTTMGSMDIDIVSISDDGQFMLLFSDLGNFGKMTAVTGKVR